MTAPEGSRAGRQAAAPPRIALNLARADEMRAEVLVRVSGDAAGTAAVVPRLAGTLTGPIRGRDVTLPTTVRLVDAPELARPRVGAGRAVFTEPAYWTPELPNLYRLEAMVAEEDAAGRGRPAASVGCMVGLRRLGVRGRSFWLDGRRWVVRGIAPGGAGFLPELFRGLTAAAVLDDPDDDACAAADRIGVAIVGWLGHGSRPFEPADAERSLERWALHPAVLLAVLPRTCAADMAGEIAARSRKSRGTLLFGLEVDGARPPRAGLEEQLAAVDFLVVDLPEAGVPHEGWLSWPLDLPLVARRRAVAAGGDAETDAAAARRHCDLLQADLASWGMLPRGPRPPRDWAGYLVAGGGAPLAPRAVSRS